MNLLKPKKLWTLEEVLPIPSPIPKEPGVYAWFFKNLPPIVPLDGCLFFENCHLMYIGIAPKAPPKNGAKPSTQRLFHRIRYHYRGNAEGSTLRLTLGCLLSKELGIRLQRVGSGKRLTFGSGEDSLSEWMSNNAFVSWEIHIEPWTYEEKLIGKLSLPLNLEKNKRHPFYPTLSWIRIKAKNIARKDNLHKDLLAK